MARKSAAACSVVKTSYFMLLASSNVCKRLFRGNDAPRLHIRIALFKFGVKLFTAHAADIQRMLRKFDVERKLAL